jgi:negative regulator of flagellin synthesis FlgM
MVETIGQMSVSGERSVIRAAAVAPAPAVATPVQTQTPPPAQPAIASQATSVAQQLSATAPLDMERVSKIKRAIADGSFPILPSTIADRLLALRLEWSPNGKA